MAISLFTPTPKDISIQFLYTIFGPVNGVISPEAEGYTTLTILGEMFRVFNSVILTVGAFIVVYVTVVGVMATAHEGQFMGKKWSNMWIPIRTVLGIASLVPTGSGYSGLQIIMMWVIVQGIGAADVLWTTALNFVQMTGSPYEKVQVMMQIPGKPGANTPAEMNSMQSMKGVFAGLVCDATARLDYPTPSIEEENGDKDTADSGYWCYFGKKSYWIFGSYTPEFCQTPIKFDQADMKENNKMKLGPSGSCGYLTWCNSNIACSDANTAETCTICNESIAKIQEILTVYAELAAVAARVDYQYRKYYYATMRGDTPPDVPWIKNLCSMRNQSNEEGNCKKEALAAPGEGLPSPGNNIVSDYYWPGAFEFLRQFSLAKTYATEYNKYMAEKTKAITDKMGKEGTLAGKFKDAGERGWALAGAYYYTVADAGNDALENTIPTLTYIQPDPNLNEPGNEMFKECYVNTDEDEDKFISCRTNIGLAATLIKLSAGGEVDSYGSTTSNSGADRASGGAGDSASAATGATESVVGQMLAGSSGEGASNPVQDLIIAGSVMLWIAQAAFAGLLIALYFAGLAGCISFYFAGYGVTNPNCGALQIATALLIPAVLAFLGFLVVTGGTLSIYVPLIPYVIFTMGVIGWFTSTIEAMVAGPLVALGIISPSGHHELLGKAEPALGLLFQIFLRPSLMIFGLIAAILLAGTMLKLFNIGMGVVFMKIAPNSPLALVMFMLVYMSMVVTVLNKCFAAIHIIPEKVVRWIGMQGEQYGESEAVSAVKGAVDKAGASMASGMASSAQGVSKAKGQKAKQDQEAEQARLSAAQGAEAAHKEMASKANKKTE